MEKKFSLVCCSHFSLQSLLPSPQRVSSTSLEDVVQYFHKTCPTKRKLALGIGKEGTKPAVVEVVEVSSEDSSEEEVQIVLENSSAG